VVQRIGLYLFLCVGQYACRRHNLEMGESAKSIFPHLCAPDIIPWIGIEEQVPREGAYLYLCFVILICLFENVFSVEYVVRLSNLNSVTNWVYNLYLDNVKGFAWILLYKGWNTPEMSLLIQFISSC